MPKRTYDPAIRQTESGARLYETWKRMRMLPHDPTWDKYPNFYAWSMSEGYAIGDKLSRYDSSRPHGPRNSFWQSPKSDEPSALWALDWCEKWDATVSKLRKRLGWPPLKGGKS